jgi:predicted HAD superfamily Cof-like phosphohydrolase
VDGIEDLLLAREARDPVQPVEMAMNTIAMVAEFHEAFSQPSAKGPTLPDTAQQGRIEQGIGGLHEALDAFKSGSVRGCRRCLRLALITEELRELAESMRDDDLVGALDALVDMRYVGDGTAVELGLHTQAPHVSRAGFVWSRFDAAFKRVHAANMAKLGTDGKPVIDAAGKIRKPEGWTHPDLSDLVL